MHSIAHFRAWDSSPPLGVDPAKIRIAGDPRSAETSIHAFTEAICLSRASPGGIVKLLPIGVPEIGSPALIAARLTFIRYSGVIGFLKKYSVSSTPSQPHSALFSMNSSRVIVGFFKSRNFRSE